MTDLTGLTTPTPSPFAPTPAAPLSGPIFTNLPSATARFERKYNQLGPLLPPNLLGPLAQFDLTRVQRGQSPLTDKETLAVLKALQTNAPASPQPRKSLYRSIIDDAKTAVGGLVKLPVTLFHEGGEILNLPKAIKDLPDASNPLEVLGNIATLPGARLFPGAFTAGQFAPGGEGIGGLQAHPLFTALDLLPYANKAAKLTPVVKAYTEQTMLANKAGVAERLAAGEAPTLHEWQRPPRPIQTALTKRLDDSGAVVPNRLGQVVDSALDAALTTKTGQALDQTFRERATSRMTGRYNAVLDQAKNPKAPLPFADDPVLAPFTRAVREDAIFRQRVSDLGPDRAEILFDAADNPRLTDGTPTLSEYDHRLTETESAMMAEYRAARERNAQLGVEAEFLAQHAGETYTISDANRLNTAQRRVEGLHKIKALRDDIDTALQPLRDSAPTQHVALRLLGDIDNGNWGSALADIKRLSGRKKYTIAADWDAVRSAVEDMRDTAKANKVRPADVGANLAKKIRAREKVYERLATNTTPARFQSKLSELTNEALTARVKSGQSDLAMSRRASRRGEEFVAIKDIDRTVDMIADGLYDQAGIDKAEIVAAKREARETLAQLRSAGFNPIGVHRVHPSAAARVDYPHVSAYPRTPAQAKQRALEMSTTVRDVGIALSDESLQWLTNRLHKEFASEFTRTYGKSRQSIEADLLPRAQAIANARGLPVKPILEKLISDRYVPDPVGKMFPSRTANVGAMTEQVLVPRAMAANFERMFAPPMPRLLAPLDKLNKVFRTAVIPLSLRVQLNNLFGGGFMVAAESPRAFRQYPRVIAEHRELVRRLKAGDETVRAPEHHAPGTPPAGYGSIGPADMRGWGMDGSVTGSSPLPTRLAATANFSFGRAMRIWYDQARDNRISKGLSAKASKVMDISYGMNELVDDINRAAIFAEAKGKGLRKLGLTEAEAQSYANSTMRRAFVAWDEMTPIERTAMRTVVPFYGFASWAVRRVLTYPMDHPLRTEVLTALARTEQTDSALGERFKDMLFLGDPTKHGPTKALALSGLNPFASTPDLFTLSGFLGSTSPVIQATLEALGVDVMRGGPMLYSNVAYDPESGRLVAQGKGLGWNTVGRFIPQADALSALAGHNEEFRQLLQSNPDSAGRMLASSLGLPTYFRTVDTGTETIKAELARYRAEDQARIDAVKSGDLSSKYPALDAYLAQIAALQKSGQLAAMMPPARNDPSALSLLPGGVLPIG